MNKTLALCLCLSVLGCTKATPPPPVVNIDVAAINAAVPEAFREKLKFEKRELTGKSMSGDVVFTFAAPATWLSDGMQLPGAVSLHPPYAMNSGYGNGTSVEVSSSCGGACVAKDWAQVAATEQLKFGTPPKTLREEKGAQSLLRVSESETSLWFEYAFWYPGSTQYFRCKVTLMKSGLDDEQPDPRVALAPFEQACKAVNITLVKK